MTKANNAKAAAPGAGVFTVTAEVHFAAGRAGRRRLRTGPGLATPAAPAVPQGRVPRVSVLMALAVKFGGLVREGVAADLSDLARLAGVSRPRMTQIMNLNHLAPDIQEQVLFLPPVEEGRDPVHERMLRPVAAEPDWERQRRRWRALSIT